MKWIGEINELAGWELAEGRVVSYMLSYKKEADRSSCSFAALPRKRAEHIRRGTCGIETAMGHRSESVRGTVLGCRKRGDRESRWRGLTAVRPYGAHSLRGRLPCRPGWDEAPQTPLFSATLSAKKRSNLASLSELIERSRA